MRASIVALALSLFLAFPAVAADEGVRSQVLVKSGASWDGSLLPDYPQTRPEVSILRIAIPSGAKLPWHRHPVINAGVLLSGELTVVTEAGATLRLKAGDPIVEVVDKWHYGINEGREPAEIIVFYVGSKDVPLAIKKPD